MSKIVEQVDDRTWTVTETIGGVVSIYNVYDENPEKEEVVRNIEKLDTTQLSLLKTKLGIAGGGTVTLNAGDGIQVTAEVDGSYTISSTVTGESVKITGGGGITVEQDPETGEYTISYSSRPQVSYIAGEGIKFSSTDEPSVVQIDAAFSGVSSITAGPGLVVDHAAGDVTISSLNGSLPATFSPAPMAAGEWYLIGNPWRIPTSGNLLNNWTTYSAGYAYFTPYYCLEDVTIDAIQFRGYVSETAYVKMMIYEGDPSRMVPTTLLAQTGPTLPSPTWGMQSILLDSGLTLTAGNTYWFGVCTSSELSITSYPYYGHNLPIIKGNSWDFAIYEHVGWQTVSNVYSEIPLDMSGVSGTYSFANYCPMIRFRKQ